MIYIIYPTSPFGENVEQCGTNMLSKDLRTQCRIAKKTQTHTHTLDWPVADILA